MRALILVAFSRLRRKPGEALLAGLVIFTSALLLSSAGSLMAGMHKPFENLFREQAGSHITFAMDTRVYDPESIFAFWKGRKNTVGITAYPAAPLSLGDRITVNGKESDQIPGVCELPEDMNAQDRLNILSTLHSGPIRDGEVWIPASLAAGLRLKPGSRIGIPTDTGLAEVTIGAVVVDPVFASPMMNPKRIWVSSGFLTSHYPASRLTSWFVGIRLAEPERAEEDWSAFLGHLGGGYNGICYRYEMLRSIHSLLTQMIALAFMVFSVLGLIAALFLVHSTIRASVTADYREIGVLKSIGFTPAQLAAGYAVQYGGIALAAALLAAPVSALLSQALMSMLLSTLGSSASGLPLASCAIISSLAVLLLATITALLSGRAAGKVKPADAIRYGAAIDEGSKQTAKPSRILPGIPSWLSLGLSALTREKRRLAFSVLTAAFTAFLLCFSADFVTTLTESAKKPSDWGMSNADVSVLSAGKRVTLSREEIGSLLSKQPGFRTSIGFDMAADYSMPPVDGKNPGILVGEVYDGDMETFGISNIRGRNPVASDEIALAVNTARLAKTDTNGTFDLFMDGRRVRFNVSGIYRSVNNMGQGFRMRAESVRQIDPLYETGTTLVLLQKGFKKTDWILQVNRKLGESVRVEEANLLFMRTFRMIIGGMSSVLDALALLFCFVLWISVFNATGLEIRENRLPFGVMKTIGFTPAGLRLTVTVNAGIVAIAGSLIGVAAAAVFSGPMVSPLLDGVLGLTGLPTLFPLSNALLCILAVVLVAAFAAWATSGRVLKIQPRTLVME
jgi:putative ABC transport system permease protein